MYKLVTTWKAKSYGDSKMELYTEAFGKSKPSGNIQVSINDDMTITLIVEQADLSLVKSKLSENNKYIHGLLIYMTN